MPSDKLLCLNTTLILRKM